MYFFQRVIEDEWKEFEEEERKDYTGLKIGQLQISDEDQGLTGTDGEGQEYGSDAESNQDPDRQKSGPWKKVVEEPFVAPLPVAPVLQEKKVYISPALRNAQTVSIFLCFINIETLVGTKMLLK